VAGLVRHAGVPETHVPLAYAAIDKIERDPPDVLAERLVAGGIPAPVADRVLTVGRLRGRPALEAALAPVPAGEDLAEGLFACVDALTHMGLGDFVDLDLSIVRGLAYYTGPVFELFDAGRSLRAICGGGRYDSLLKALGGVDLPAVGFGMGDVVLGELIASGAAAGVPGDAVRAFLVAVGSDDVPHVLALAHRLRDAGIGVEFALKDQGLGKQLKLAAARGAAQAVIVGPGERAEGVAVVRDLATGGERRVAMERIQDALANL
jgi:histidyl-tRNA synthetase